MIPTKRSHLVFTASSDYKMAPPSANKRRKNLTVKQANLKKRKTRQPTSNEKPVAVNPTVATLEKNGVRRYRR